MLPHTEYWQLLGECQARSRLWTISSQHVDRPDSQVKNRKETMDKLTVFSSILTERWTKYPMVITKKSVTILCRTSRNSFLNQAGKERFHIADFILVAQSVSGKGDKQHGHMGDRAMIFRRRQADHRGSLH